MLARYLLLGCSAIALAGGCAAVTAPSADARCPTPGGEFASNGCAVVSGVVRDANGRGMPAATVTVSVISECGGCFGIAVADNSGSFRIVIWRYDLLPGVPLRDSVSATVRALATGGYPRPPGDTYYGDSTSTILVFAAIGAPVKKSEVTLAVRIP